jgi:hypothetical protein
MNSLVEICQRTNYSWGIDVLLLEDNKIQVSTIFESIFQSCLAHHIQEECVCIFLGIDENNLCRSKVQFAPCQNPGLKFYVFDTNANFILPL